MVTRNRSFKVNRKLIEINFIIDGSFATLANDDKHIIRVVGLS